MPCLVTSTEVVPPKRTEELGNRFIKERLYVRNVLVVDKAIHRNSVGMEPAPNKQRCRAGIFS